MTRADLMAMRKTLIEKCEEVINSDRWPHGKNKGGLTTAKIFNDLLQFYGDTFKFVSAKDIMMHQGNP